MPSRNPLTLDKVMRIIATIIGIGIAVWLINYLRNVLLPFFAACLIAYILNPVVEFQLNKFRLRYRAIAVFLTVIEATGIIAFIGYLMVPLAITEIGQLDKMIADSGEVTSPFIPRQVQDYLRAMVTSDNLAEFISGSKFETLLSRSSSMLTEIIDYLLHTLEWLLMFIYAIFIMLDYHHLMWCFKVVVPPKYRRITYRVADDVKDSMNRYFRGQVVIAMFAAVFYSIGFKLVGLPLAIIIGALVGVLYLIPYFQYVTLIPVAVLCYMDAMTGTVSFWPIIGKCLLVYVVSQCICDYILTPKIMKKALGLNPAIILLALSVWGSLLGIIGMIIALPMTTLLLAYYKEYILHNNLNVTVDSGTNP